MQRKSKRKKKHPHSTPPPKMTCAEINKIRIKITWMMNKYSYHLNAFKEIGSLDIFLKGENQNDTFTRMMYRRGYLCITYKMNIKLIQSSIQSFFFLYSVAKKKQTVTILKINNFICNLFISETLYSIICLLDFQRLKTKDEKITMIKYLSATDIFFHYSFYPLIPYKIFSLVLSDSFSLK